VTAARPGDPIALQAAFDAAERTLHAAEFPDPVHVSAADDLAEARDHAGRAYPPGTPEAAALTLLLDSIAAEVAALAASPVTAC
jgi:hypothetical protein